MGLTGKGECITCGNYRTLPAKGKCDKCYRAEFYDKNPEAKAKREANQKERAKKYYEANAERQKARQRENYAKKRAEGGVTRTRKPQTKRKVLTEVAKKDAIKATDAVYNSSAKLCALCSRKVGRGEVMLWKDDLDVVHKVCGWAAEARANIERREHAARSQSDQEPMRSVQLGAAVREDGSEQVQEPLS